MRNNKKHNQPSSFWFSLLLLILQIPFTIGTILKIIFQPIITIGVFSLFLVHTIYLAGSWLVIALVNNILLGTKKTINGVATIWSWIGQAYVTLLKYISEIIKTVSRITSQLAGSIPYRPIIASTLFVASVTLIASLTFFGITHIENQPYPKHIQDYSIQQPIYIYDANNYLFFEAFSHPPSEFLTPADIPVTLSHSVVNLVDPYFYKHPGITPRYVLGGLQETLFHIPSEPAFSISQQLAQNSLNNTADSLPELIQELLLTFQLERQYSKDELLAMYLSIQNIGTEVGAQSAAQTFFHKHLTQLDDRESLLLANLLNQDLMTSIASVGPNSQQFNTSNVVQLLLTQFGTGTEIRDGLTIHSTVDLAYQTNIQQLLISEFAEAKTTIPKITVLITNPNTGSIIALTGQETDPSILQLVVAASQNYVAQTTYPKTPIHAVNRITTAKGETINPQPRNSISVLNQVKASEQILSTYTSSAIVTLWIDPETSAALPSSAAQNILDSLANYALETSAESVEK